MSICCNKTISDVSDGEPFHWRRRDVLKCAGATVGLVRAILLQFYNKVFLFLFVFTLSIWWICFTNINRIIICTTIKFMFLWFHVFYMNSLVGNLFSLNIGGIVMLANVNSGLETMLSVFCSLFLFLSIIEALSNFLWLVMMGFKSYCNNIA